MNKSLHAGFLGVIVAVIIIIVGIAILWLIWLFAWNHASVTAPQPSVTISPLPSSSPSPSLSNQSVSDGNIAFSYGQDWGLAVTPQQILVSSYIPPCDSSFNYCLYYNGTAYQGTNFESAGLRIKKRTDLKTQSACLNTPPAGFAITPEKTLNADSYSASAFNVGQAAAGHFSSGYLYRVYVSGQKLCYEFETRIGQSDFNNYPSGTIKQFTNQDQQQLNAQLMNILSGVTLPGGVPLKLPATK